MGMIIASVILTAGCVHWEDIQGPSGQDTSGSLYVTSSPSASLIFIDGSLEGTTPFTVKGLSSGEHKIKLVKPGYADSYSTVTINPGDESTYSGSLSPENSGLLHITVTPSSTTWYLDGEKISTISGSYYYTVSADEPYYQLGVVKPGYKGHSQSVEIEAGTQKEIVVNLEKLPSSYNDVDITCVGSFTTNKRYLVSNYGDTTKKISFDVVRAKDSNDEIISSDSISVTLLPGKSEVMTVYLGKVDKNLDTYFQIRNKKIVDVS